MLGDTHSIGNVGLVGAGVESCRLDNQVFVHTADLGHSLRSVLLDALPQLFNTLRMFLNIFFVFQALLEDYVKHSVAQCHTGAWINLQIDIRQIRQRNADRICHNDFLAHSVGLAYIHSHNRMGFRSVGASDEDDICLLDFRNTVGHGTAS